MIRILDENFDILLTIPYHTSVVWEKRFTEGGSFSISLPVNFETNIDLSDKIIYYNNNYGIIKYINITSSTIEIKGYNLKGILAMRQVNKKSYSGNIETVMKNIVSDNTKENRGFPNFQITEDKQRGDIITYEIAAYDSVENVLKDICTQYNVGYDITVNNKKMQFDVLFPQTVDIIYSKRKKNITDFQYTYDILDNVTVVKNHGTADGVQIDVNKKGSSKWYVDIKGKVCFPNGQIKEVDESCHFTASADIQEYVNLMLTDNGGISVNISQHNQDGYVLVGLITIDNSENASTVSYPTSNEYISYIGDTEPTGYKRNEISTEISEVTEKTKAEMNKKLYENTSSENIIATLLSRDDYKIKWNLGDFIKVKIYIMGQSMVLTKQITEVEEVYEPNNMQINPTFGKNKDNIIRKIVKGRLKI